ncbi:hypothetical protein ACSBR1_026161 [Camellia fascicularis]
MKGGRSKTETKRTDSKLSVKRGAPSEKAGKKPAAKKGKAAKDPNKPKRPASAFFVFMEEFRKMYKEKHPNNKSVAAVGKAGEDKWKSLSEASFKQMTASCLVKDPSKRPSANKLLKHSFFKQARSNDYILRTLLEGLPALSDRLKALKNEYKRGISGWNFNLEDVKAQDSLIQDEDTPSEQDQGGRSITSSGLDVEKKFQYQLSFASHSPQVSDIVC